MVEQCGAATSPPGGGGRNKEIGRIGERHAEALVVSRGGTVLARNWSCREAELDLIVLDDAGRLRFVEVKARSGDMFGTPAEAVTERKLARIRVAARHWLAANPGGWRQVCFDVIGVDLSDPDNPRLELFEDVM